MSARTAIVVGGGLGGLATALRLRASGWRVTVCDEGQRFGGKMNLLERDGFRFDTGPSLITMPWIFEDLFRVAGSRLEDHVELVPVSPTAEYHFDDGTRFAYSTMLPEWLDTVRELEPRDVDGFLRFIGLGARLFALSKATFFRRPPLDPPDAQSFRALLRAPLRGGWGNYHRAIEAHFKSPYLRQLFDRYPTYVGSSAVSLARDPRRSSPTSNSPSAVGMSRGGLYRSDREPRGPRRAAGIELRANARVERIERGEPKGSRSRPRRRNEALGRRRRDERRRVDGGRAARRKGWSGFPRRERSLVGPRLVLLARRTLAPDAPHHAVYFSVRLPARICRTVRRAPIPMDPTVYVCTPSRGDRRSLPRRARRLFVMANAPANDGESTGPETLDEARRRVFVRLARGGFPDVGSDTIVSEVWAPSRICP